MILLSKYSYPSFQMTDSTKLLAPLNGFKIKSYVFYQSSLLYTSLVYYLVKYLLHLRGIVRTRGWTTIYAAGNGSSFTPGHLVHLQSLPAGRKAGTMGCSFRPTTDLLANMGNKYWFLFSYLQA
jgi:hypothetical protein